MVFTLLEELAKLGVTKSSLARIDITLIDIDARAVAFLKDNFRYLEHCWGTPFSNVQFNNCNFLNWDDNPKSKRQPFYFGNPPFVKNSPGSAWKNSFADFLQRAVEQTAKSGVVHFILPLSIAFSRDYKKLREIILGKNRTLFLSHYDNIPDTLFKSGKPNHAANTANSQRCTIFTMVPSHNNKVYSTKLHRWSKKSRKQFLTSSFRYHDVTKFNCKLQIPRPENTYILNYTESAHAEKRLQSIVAKDGTFVLHVAGVARNYIGVRMTASSANHEFRFTSEADRLRFLLVISSDLFLAYWKSFGDGFHITKTDLLEAISKPFDKRYHRVPVHR